MSEPAGARTVSICDVAPRDGLQNESRVLEAAVRAELVNRLARAGVARIQIGSFVSAARVPQMAEPEAVVAGIDRVDGVSYAGLVVNERGYERLAATSLDEVHFAFAATESLNQRNAGLTVEDSVRAAERIAGRASLDGLRATLTIGVSFGCPFEGEVDPAWVLELAARLVAAGANEIVFADTIGVAVPRQIRQIVSESLGLGVPVGVHLHNTRNTAFANAHAAVEAGATTLESSVGGIGGCPFAPRATGNICTEDLVYLLHGDGWQTGISLEGLVSVAQWLEGVLGRQLDGQVYRAGTFAPVAA
jgi:isopropylmalate/homocitrate/citramalate synthase